MTNNITEINVYWDSQDPRNEGWVVSWRDGDKDKSDAIDGIADDDLDGAILEACRMIDADLDPHHFAREPHVDGGVAEWSLVEG